VPVPRLKPFGQLKLSVAGPETMMFADTDVGYPAWSTHGSEATATGPSPPLPPRAIAAKSFCAGSMWNSSPRTRSAIPMAADRLSAVGIGNRRCAPHPLSDHQLQHGRRLAQMDHQDRPAGRQRDFNTKLVGLQIASSYACRRRNSAATGKLSEHAKEMRSISPTSKFSDRVEASVAGGWNGASRGLSITNREAS